MVEMRYYTRRNSGAVNLAPEEAKRVIAKVQRYFGKGSIPGGTGRIYFLKGGTLEHRMGPQPEIIIKSPCLEGLEMIAEKFGLPL